MVVNHGLREPRRGSSRLQLVRGTEELLGEDGPGGPERVADPPSATQLLQLNWKGLSGSIPSLGWKAAIGGRVGVGTGTKMTSGEGSVVFRFVLVKL